MEYCRFAGASGIYRAKFRAPLRWMGKKPPRARHALMAGQNSTGSRIREGNTTLKPSPDTSASWLPHPRGEHSRRPAPLGRILSPLQAVSSAPSQPRRLKVNETMGANPAGAALIREKVCVRRE
jgi:hypothetical protein